MNPALAGAQVLRRLRIVRGIALLDLLLLVGLVASSLAGRREFVSLLGPLHGVNFLLLLAVAITAALDGLWGWWSPAAILLTAGPPGALVGEWVIARRIASEGRDAGQRGAGGR